MRWGQQRIRNHEMTEDAARGAMGGGGSGSMATALLSAFALLFSGLSLYETVLKRADLRIYVPQVVHYGRTPSGDSELFAIPITISNTGARDAAVTAIRMRVTPVDQADATPRTFYSAYFIGAPYFAKSKGFNRATKTFDRNPRPKQPFAPIAVAGRGAYTGTILFNVVGKTFPPAVSQAGAFRLDLQLETEANEGFGLTDRLLATTSEPITLTVKLPYFSKQSLSFDMTRLYDVRWDEAKPAQEGAPAAQD